MASTWWKIMVLQILISIATRSMAYEPDGVTKLSNENIVWLFKNFLENLKKQNAIEDFNGKADPIRYFYHTSSSKSSKSTQNVENSTENQIESDDERQLTSEYIENLDIIKNNNKRNYVTLCHFKICNTKKSIDGYDSFIRYLTQRYNSLHF